MDTMLEILKYIQSFSNQSLASFFEIVTMLGEEWFFIIVVAIFLYLGVHWPSDVLGGLINIEER